MKFTEVKELPERTITTYKRPQYVFEEFLRLNIKIAKVEFNKNEYSSTQSAFANCKMYAKRDGYPIDVRMRNGELYFIRRDM